MKFGDGKKLSPIGEVKYLGCVLNSRGDGGKEVSGRIANCTVILKKMHLFFYGSNCSVRQKLIAYNAVIRSKLMYGLESSMLNTSVLSRLDAFQMKGIRKIMHMPTTYIDRSYSNKRVWEEAAAEIGDGGTKGLQRLSEYHEHSRIRLLCKLITNRHVEAGAAATFDAETLRPHDYGKRRVGRPRLNWYQCTMESLWELAKRSSESIRYAGAIDLGNAAHVQHLLRQAAEVHNKAELPSQGANNLFDTATASPGQLPRNRAEAPVALHARFVQGGDHFMTTSSNSYGHPPAAQLERSVAG